MTQSRGTLVSTNTMSSNIGKYERFGEQFNYYSNFEFCLENDCEDSDFFLGKIDILRVEFADATKVRLYANVSRDIYDESQFDDFEAVVYPSSTVLSESKLQVIEHLMRISKFPSFIRNQFVNLLLKWN